MRAQGRELPPQEAMNMAWFQKNGTAGDPPVHCDICGRILENYAVDGKVKGGG